MQGISPPIEPARIYVVVPAYNEGQVIQQVIAGLVSKNYSVVVVDDGSELPLINTLHQLPVFLLRHKINLGQGAALQTGFEFCIDKGAAVIVTFDADGQHSINDIEMLVDALLASGADVALGSRFLDGISNIPTKRQWLLQVARYINYVFTGLLLTDAHNGIRAFTAAALEQITISENRMAHATEIISNIKRQQLKYIEVPVVVHYTTYSKSKGQKLPDAFRVLFDLFLHKLFR